MDRMDARRVHLSCLLVPLLLAAAGTTTLDRGVAATGFRFPIVEGLTDPAGLDYHPLKDSLVVSVDSTREGGTGFESISTEGDRTQYGRKVTWPAGAPVVVVKGEVDRFEEGDVFSSKREGQIAKLNVEGTLQGDPWVRLPGERGRIASLVIDRTSVFGGDLIAGTSTGHIWQVTPSGQPTLLATAGGPITAVLPIPKAERYGEWAGTLLAATTSPACRILSITPAGAVKTHDLGICAGDLELVLPEADLFVAAMIKTEDGTVGALLKTDAVQLGGSSCDVIASDTSGALVTFGPGGPSASRSRINLDGALPRGLAFADGGNTCAPEICGDRIDNDDDGEVDEGCEEVCGDGVDNNADEDIDEGCPEVCADGEDNDNNGLVDDGCAEVCGDRVDNDGDDEIDVPCPEVCKDGIDNDQNGQTDENCPPEPVSAGCSPEVWLANAPLWVGLEGRQISGTIFSLNDALAPIGVMSVSAALAPGTAEGTLGAGRLLVRASIAALLNAGSPKVGYPISKDRILTNVNAALESQRPERMEALASVLEALNQVSCPLKPPRK